MPRVYASVIARGLDLRESLSVPTGESSPLMRSMQVKHTRSTVTETSVDCEALSVFARKDFTIDLSMLVAVSLRVCDDNRWLVGRFECAFRTQRSS
jgi:hypothetical protein